MCRRPSMNVRFPLLSRILGSSIIRQFVPSGSCGRWVVALELIISRRRLESRAHRRQASITYSTSGSVKYGWIGNESSAAASRRAVTSGSRPRRVRRLRADPDIQTDSADRCRFRHQRAAQRPRLGLARSPPPGTGGWPNVRRGRPSDEVECLRATPDKAARSADAARSTPSGAAGAPSGGSRHAARRDGC